MEDCPKVTVITITKNLYDDDRIALFQRCLESVHAQTYPNIEHIIIDGASTDGTLAFVTPYEKKGWIRVFSQEDDGIDDAYNKGTAKASGEYLAWMNSDDFYYDNTAVANAMQALVDEQADFSYGKQITIDRSGNKLWEFVPRMHVFFRDMPFSHQTLFVKKSVLEAIGGYNTDYGISGDYNLVLQLILHDYKGVFVDKYISYYTTGGFSCSLDNQYRVHTCTSILAKRSLAFYRKFYPDMDEDEAELIYWKGESCWAYPPMFLQKMIRYMVEKRLVHFDYNTFITYVNGIIESEYRAKDRQYFIAAPTQTIVPTKKFFYLFNGLKLLSVEKYPGKTYFKLFGVIPLLKIREK